MPMLSSELSFTPAGMDGWTKGLSIMILSTHLLLRAWPPAFRYKGVLPIIASWFVAPVLTAFTSGLIFGLCRFLVLRREKAYALSFWVLPPMVALTTFINVYFILTKVSRAGCEVYFIWAFTWTLTPGCM